GDGEDVELLLEGLVDDGLELVAVVRCGPAEVVVERQTVLVLQVAAEPARLALDLARVAEVDEDAERLAVADDVAAVGDRLQLDLGDEVLVIVEDLAGFLGLLVIADDLEAGLEVAELHRRADRAESAE